MKRIEELSEVELLSLVRCQKGIKIEKIIEELNNRGATKYLYLLFKMVNKCYHLDIINSIASLNEPHYLWLIFLNSNDDFLDIVKEKLIASRSVRYLNLLKNRISMNEVNEINDIVNQILKENKIKDKKTISLSKNEVTERRYPKLWTGDWHNDMVITTHEAMDESFIYSNVYVKKN